MIISLLIQLRVFKLTIIMLKYTLISSNLEIKDTLKNYIFSCLFLQRRFNTREQLSHFTHISNICNVCNFFSWNLRTFFLHVGIQIKYGIVLKILVLLLLILILILLSGLYHNGIMFLRHFKNFLGTIYWKIWQQFNHFLFYNGILFLRLFKNIFKVIVIW